MKITLFNKSNVQTTFSVKKIASFSLVQCNFFEVFSIEHGKGRLCQCQLRKHFFTCIRSSFLKSSINHCLESLQPLFFKFVSSNRQHIPPTIIIGNRKRCYIIYGKKLYFINLHILYI